MQKAPRQNQQQQHYEKNHTKKHKKRQPRKQPYQKVTTYTQRPSIQFILTIILFLIQLIMHIIFMTRAIVRIDHSILYVMWGLMYVLLFIILIDYIQITCFDPADGVLLNPTYNLKFQQNDLRYCDICTKNVHKNTYHCMRCNRCTQQFDHHCKYLNNCIGSRNYQSFLRILLIMIAYNLDIIGQGIWIFIQASNSDYINEGAFSRWVVLAIMIISLIILITVSVLLGFHIYINCCVEMTTLEYLYQDQQEQSDKKDRNKDKKHQSASGMKMKSTPKIISAQNLKYNGDDNF